MVMKTLGYGVSSHPKKTVIILVVISIIAAGAIGVFGINQEFSESAFMPDHEVIVAQREMGQLFSTTNVRTVSILVRGNHEDVMTSGAMVEMLTVGQRIVNDPDIGPTLMYPQMPSVNFNSVAGVIAQTALAAQGNPNPTMEEMIGVMEDMSDDDIKMTVAQILSSEHTPPQVKGMFTMLLTRDFMPQENRFGAKGTMLFIMLNGSLAHDELGEGMTTEENPLSLSEKRMDQIVREEDLESTTMRVMGGSLIMNEIMEESNKNIRILFPLAFLLVIVILVIVFRNITEVFICLTALAMGILWMYGFGTVLGFSFNPMTLVVPILMVGLGIDYGIHLTMRHREETRKGSDLEQASGNTVKFVGTALLLVTITTAAAFMSNLSSPMGPLREFGFIATIGIISSFITMVTFVPACLHLKDLRKARKDKKNDKKVRRKRVPSLSRFISLGASSSKTSAVIIIAVVLIISAAATYGAVNLETRFDFEDFLPDNLDISRDLNFMLNEFPFAGGEASEIQLLVKGDIAEPEVYDAIQRTIERMGDEQYIVQIGGEPDVKWIGSIMEDWATEVPTGFPDGNYNETFSYMYHSMIGEDGMVREGVNSTGFRALYDWLYMNPLSHTDTVSVIHMDESGLYDATALRISITLTGTESKEMNSLMDNIAVYKEPIDSVSESAVLTGGSVVGTIMLDVLNRSALNSLITTLIVCTLIMVIVFYIKEKSFMLGILTMVPVLLCVLWILGTMYVWGISLNIMTLMVTSLTIGIGVDYGIHISNRFTEDMKKFREIPDAMNSTVTNTGLALFGGAASTIAGFGLIGFATLPPVAQFGLITAMTILYSSVAAVYLLPTLLMMWAKHRKG